MITVRQVEGPDPAFLYIEASDPDYPACTRRHSLSCAALADGTITVAAERAVLVASVEQAITNWQAAQAALADL